MADTTTSRPVRPAQMPRIQMPRARPTPGVQYPEVPNLTAIRKQARADHEADRVRMGQPGPTVGTPVQRRGVRPLQGQARPHARLPRLWLAIRIPSAQLFDHLLVGERHVVEICECEACLTVLDRQIKGRSRREHGRARLVLLPRATRTRTGMGDLAPKILLARGVVRRGPNLVISRVVVVEQRPDGLLAPAAAAALDRGHLVALPATLFSPSVASLVARLPAPMDPLATIPDKE